jgi:hypothetical protein
VKTYFVDLNLHAIPDPQARKRCLSMPTAFSLPNKDVDLLIESGRSLLAAHPEFQKLLLDFK